MWNFSEPSSTDHTYYMDTTVTNSKALSCKPIFVKFVLIVLIIPILQVSERLYLKETKLSCGF